MGSRPKLQNFLFETCVRGGVGVGGYLRGAGRYSACGQVYVEAAIFNKNRSLIFVLRA